MHFDQISANMLFVVISAAVLTVTFIMFYFRTFAALETDADREQRHRCIYEMVASIVSSPSENNMIDEIKQLKSYIGNNRYSFDALSDAFFEQLDAIGEGNEHVERALFKIIDIIRPDKYYSVLLRKGSAYDKAYACRRLADYAVYDEIKNIENNLDSKNEELSYNAAMALSRLGDQEGVSSFVIGCKDNFRISRHVVLQLLGEYNEDIKALAGLVFQECDDYTKANVIKALSKYNFVEFEDVYLESMKSKNATLRVAAVTAIGNFADIKYEPNLVIAAHDRVWIVRNAAVKALGLINSKKSLEVVTRATSDMEWWVRYNAAKTLIAMDNGMEAAKNILDKFDSYAADAVRYVMSRDVSF